MIRIAVIGVGKIAQDQHLASIERSELFELIAAVDPQPIKLSVPVYPSLSALLEAGEVLDAVSLCMPPKFRYAAALNSLCNGWHVMLEKPPAASISEALRIQDAALGLRKSAATGSPVGKPSVYGAWHSRQAQGVPIAKSLIAGAQVHSVEMRWHEDVTRWHPNQEWVWQAGGFGVFDPGINGFSILFEILDQTISVSQSTLWVPANKAMPIAAALKLHTESGCCIDVSLDWRASADSSMNEQWSIRLDTSKGVIELTEGGANCWLNDEQAAPEPDLLSAPLTEYDRLYRNFAGLIKRQESDLDVRPLALVADCFVLAERIVCDPV